MPAEGRENPLLKKGNSDAFFREKYLTKNNCYFKNWLIEAGVEDATAEQEACRIEHDISEQSFQKLKRWKELEHSEETNGD